MRTSTNSIEFKFERTITASPEEIYDAWLNPAVPGTPWNKADKVIMDPKVDGLFWFVVVVGYPHSHYGRFTWMDRPGRIQLTWMSPNTMGQESAVIVTFEKKGEETLMTLVHSGLPDTEGGREHEEGWNYFMDLFAKQFVNDTEKK